MNFTPSEFGIGGSGFADTELEAFSANPETQFPLFSANP
jgi:hypothetical protein